MQVMAELLSVPQIVSKAQIEKNSGLLSSYLLELEMKGAAAGCAKA